MDKFLEQFSRIPFHFKVLALLVSLLVIVGGNYSVIILEKQSTIDEYNENILTTTQALTGLKKDAAEKEKTETTITKLKESLLAAEAQLPKKAEIPQLLKDIEYEAEQSGLTFERFTPMGEMRRGDFAHVPVTMNVQGSYHEFALFLERLAQMPRIVNATGLSLTGPKKTEKGISLTGNFLATTYRYLDENERKGGKGTKAKKKGKRGRKRTK